MSPVSPCLASPDLSIVFTSTRSRSAAGSLSGSKSMTSLKAYVPASWRPMTLRGAASAAENDFRNSRVGDSSAPTAPPRTPP